jgi:hypothetical protein
MSKKKISSIKVYKPRNKYKNYRIFFSDIETILDSYNKHIPISISLVCGDNHYIFDNIIDYINHVINNCSLSIIYFHNFGKFDSTFIINSLLEEFRMGSEINIIQRNSIIYQLELVKYSIMFRDTYLLIPLSLDKLGETFCVNNRKFTDLDYSDISNIYKSNPYKIHKHCLNDTLVLQEGFYVYKKSLEDEFGIHLLDCLTLPSISYNIFRMRYYDYCKAMIAKNPFKTDEFIRRAYKGGIAEVYIPYMTNGYCYDANSLYPYIMKTSKFPVGKPMFISGDKIDINNYIGFIECEVYSDKEYNFLTYRCSKRGLITPVGIWRDVYYYTEVKKAIDMGYKIKFLKGVVYESEEYMFVDFVNDIYKKRIESKSISINYICKMILNSLYGRFGMQILVESSKFLTAEELFRIKSRYSIININRVGTSNFYNVSLRKKNTTSKDEYRNTIDTETAVQIAAVITANARIYMHDFKNIPNNKCYYTDTDSIFLEKPLDNIYIGKELGMFKLEYIVKEGMFISPKVYYINKGDGNDKIVVKGLRINTDNERISIIKEFRNIIFNNDSFMPYIYKRISYFRRNLNKLIIYKTYDDIIMSFPFNKRNKIYNNNVWVNTKAVFIKIVGMYNLSSKMK